MNRPEYQVQLGDVTTEKSDLLLLKHAQGFYGADKAVASSLAAGHICEWRDLRVLPGHNTLVETKGIIAPSHVMFLGTPSLGFFGYDEMEQFARSAIDAVVALAPSVEIITTTVHGVGYGLDGGESLLRLIRGFDEGLSRNPVLTIKRVIFLTMDHREERTLASVLAGLKLPKQHYLAITPPSGTEFPADAKENATVKQSSSENLGCTKLLKPAPTKKRAFVAMPYAEEFQNVYEFGIYPAVRACGFICERVDETHFTGDVLLRIKTGIEAASIVIADLTQGRPNVYLEVGYAWGRGIRVIFLARKGESLHFDVSTHKCLYYGKFTQLANDLGQLLRGLESSGEI